MLYCFYLVYLRVCFLTFSEKLEKGRGVLSEKFGGFKIFRFLSENFSGFRFFLIKLSPGMFRGWLFRILSEDPKMQPSARAACNAGPVCLGAVCGARSKKTIDIFKMTGQFDCHVEQMLPVS